MRNEGGTALHAGPWQRSAFIQRKSRGLGEWERYECGAAKACH